MPGPKGPTKTICPFFDCFDGVEPAPQGAPAAPVNTPKIINAGHPKNGPRKVSTPGAPPDTFCE